MSKWKEMQQAEQEAEAVQIEPAEEDKPTLDSAEQNFLGMTDAMIDSFKSKMEKENKRIDDVVDSGYFFIVCFKNRAQMDECCDILGVDKTRLCHEGREFMRAIKRVQRVPDPEFPAVRPIDKDYARLAMDK